MRLFAAVDLDAEARAALSAEARRIAGRFSEGGRAVWKPLGPELLHLTIKFLAEVDTARVGAIGNVLQKAASEVESFRFLVEGIGVFPCPARARILWAGVGKGAAELARLASRVDAACGAVGFMPEERPFAAHVTLARLGRGRPSDVREFLENEHSPVLAPQRVHELVLYESRTAGSGPAYFRVAAFPLGAAG